MAIGILGPLNTVINKTAKEMADSDLLGKAAKVLNTFVTSSFEALDSVLAKVQDLTKDESTPTPP